MELRKDYILDRWVIIAAGRGKRPHELSKGKEDLHVDPKSCIFCPGNESSTPPEIGRIRNTAVWELRWFPNKFGIVDKKGTPNIRTDNDFFTVADAYGQHEVIVETPHHTTQLWDFSEEELKNVLNVYARRIDELINEPNIKYISVFKNHGAGAGTSIEHSHSQVISLNTVPTYIRRKIEASKKHQSCPYCRILNIEKGSHRRVYENKSFVAFTPYASRFNYEVWVFPKNHYKNLNDFSEDDVWMLASAMKFVLKKLKEINVDYNMTINYAPKGEDLHFHIEFCPRIDKWAGFEIETGIIVNTVSPEDAAKFYRGEQL